MSLLKLLTVGKTWMGIKDRPTEFKMREENLLPTFEASLKPWSTTTVPSKKIEPTAPVDGARLAKADAATDFFPRAEFCPKTAGARKSPQGELTVIRNDLSDADLEVVRKAKGTVSIGNPSGTVWSRVRERMLDKTSVQPHGH
jgi:hypothetical protein